MIEHYLVTRRVQLTSIFVKRDADKNVGRLQISFVTNLNSARSSKSEKNISHNLTCIQMTEEFLITFNLQPFWVTRKELIDPIDVLLLEFLRWWTTRLKIELPKKKKTSLNKQRQPFIFGNTYHKYKDS